MRAGKTNVRVLGVVLAAAVALWSALPAPAQAAKRVALVIGNSAYEHTDALRTSTSTGSTTRSASSTRRRGGRT